MPSRFHFTLSGGSRLGGECLLKIGCDCLEFGVHGALCLRLMKKSRKKQFKRFRDGR